jgi:hypothetical protein
VQFILLSSVEMMRTNPLAVIIIHFEPGVRKKRLVAGCDIGRCHYEINEAAVTSKQDKVSPKTPSPQRKHTSPTLRINAQRLCSPNGK